MCLEHETRVRSRGTRLPTPPVTSSKRDARVYQGNKPRCSWARAAGLASSLENWRAVQIWVLCLLLHPSVVSAGEGCSVPLCGILHLPLLPPASWPLHAVSGFLFLRGLCLPLVSAAHGTCELKPSAALWLPFASLPVALSSSSHSQLTLSVPQREDVVGLEVPDLDKLWIKCTPIHGLCICHTNRVSNNSIVRLPPHR